VIVVVWWHVRWYYLDWYKRRAFGKYGHIQRSSSHMILVEKYCLQGWMVRFVLGESFRC
jgi:hypothetical protein